MNVRTIVTLLFCITAILATTMTSAEEGIIGSLVVIAHKDVPIDTISEYDLLDYYSYDIQEYENDLPIILFDLADNDALRAKFYNFMGKKSSRMKSIWLKKMLAGEGDPPETMSTEEAMVAKVSVTPGAIGFVSLGAVTDKVKILTEIE